MAEAEQEQQTLSVYLAGGGTPLSRDITRRLVADGHSVAVWVATSQQAIKVREDGGLPVYGDADNPVILADNLRLTEANAVLNLAPANDNVAPTLRRDWTVAAAKLQTETEALAEAIAANDAVETFVQVSYALVYADSEEAVTEDDPLREDGSAFLKAAVAADKAVREAGGTVVRAGFLFSDAPNDPLVQIQTTLRRSLTPSYFGNPNAKANWVLTGDLASFLVSALEADELAPAYNLAYETPYSVYSFAKLFGEKVGLSMPNNLPPSLARPAVGAETFALLNASVAVDSTRARENLGWSPSFASVDTALEDILLTWRTRV